MEPVAYKNYRIMYNSLIDTYCLTEVRYNAQGKIIRIPNPLVMLGNTLTETEEVLEGLLSDVKNHEKEILVLDKSGKLV